ncbi:MAG: FtsX-like permease family protein [bacterium]|nr:FtsX-like permease family protein [bacterium]
MIKHLFKLVWNRKRANSLILIEILISFLVLCGLFSTAIFGVQGYKSPLGFDYRDRWLMHISGEPRMIAPLEEREAARASLGQMIDMVRALPEVRSASVTYNCPYSGMRVMSVVDTPDGQEQQVIWGASTAEALPTLGLELREGRWFEEGDETRDEIPVVLSQNLAELFFGKESAVGRLVPEMEDESEDTEDDEEDQARRIVGVITDYRCDGELARAPYTIFRPLDIADVDDIFPSNFIIHVQPGTDASFEEILNEKLQEIQPGWSFAVSRLTDMRDDRLKNVIMPFVVVCIVAAFLVTMVGLGLVGVLWQNLLRRTAELGLRRAMGASAWSVQRQILGELLVLSLLAMFVGSVLFLQFPLLGIIGFVSWSTYLLALALSLISIAFIVALCGLVPSWLATRITPAQALSYE